MYTQLQSSARQKSKKRTKRQRKREIEKKKINKTILGRVNLARNSLSYVVCVHISTFVCCSSFIVVYRYFRWMFHRIFQLRFIFFFYVYMIHTMYGIWIRFDSRCCFAKHFPIWPKLVVCASTECTDTIPIFRFWYLSFSVLMSHAFPSFSSAQSFSFCRSVDRCRHTHSYSSCSCGALNFYGNHQHIRRLQLIFVRNSSQNPLCW